MCLFSHHPHTQAGRWEDVFSHLLAVLVTYGGEQTAWWYDILIDDLERACAAFTTMTRIWNRLDHRWSTWVHLTDLLTGDECNMPDRFEKWGMEKTGYPIEQILEDLAGKMTTQAHYLDASAGTIEHWDEFESTMEQIYTASGDLLSDAEVLSRAQAVWATRGGEPGKL